jgi:hypothetical protein
MHLLLCSLLLLCSISVAQAQSQRPEIVLMTDYYFVLHSPVAQHFVVTDPAKQTLIADHVMVQKRDFSPNFTIKTQSTINDKLLSHIIDVYLPISEPFVRVQLVEKKQNEFGYEYIAQLETNIPSDLITHSQVSVNGVSIDVQMHTPFKVSSYQPQLVISSELTIARYKTVSNTQQWQHSLPSQVDCDLLHETVYVEAICYTNRDPITQIIFLIDGVQISTQGRLFIGDTLPDDLQLKVSTSTQTLNYKVQGSVAEGLILSANFP